MKEVRINWLNDHKPEAPHYVLSKPEVALLNWTGPGTFEQVAGFYGCREFFTEDLINYFKDPGKWRKPKPNFKRLRTCWMLNYSNDSSVTTKLRFKKNFESKMQNSVRLLHIFERHLGWSLSKVFAAGPQNYMKKNRMQACVLSSSIKWARSTQLLSLYLLIARAAHSKNFFKNFKSMDDFKAVFSKSSEVHDILLLKKMKWHIPVILKHHNKLFFDRPMKEHYKKSSYTQGISSFTQNNPKCHSALKEKWIRIRSKERAAK